MWEIPRFRIRAYVKAIQKQRSDRRAASNKNNTRMKRTQAQLITSNGFGVPVTIIPARVVLNDMQPTEMALFATEPFEEGSVINLTIEEPRRFFITGRVVSCFSNEANTRILTQQAYHYRIRLRFLFNSMEEVVAVKEYCEYLNRVELRRVGST